MFVPGQVTIEPGISYAYSDSNALTLNGFLALGSIFLGNINVSKITSNIETFSLEGTYSPTGNFQIGVDVPYLLRQSTYQSVGAQNSTAQASEEDVSNNGQIGDVSLLLNYEFLGEGEDYPAVIWNNQIKAPTGRSPYGIQIVTQPQNNNLNFPSALATGNGVWSYTTGLSFIKTTSPAILFGNISYTYNFRRHVGNINSQPPSTPGDVSVGDIFGFGFGTAFAINDKMSMTFGYDEKIAQETRLRPDGGGWQNIVGSNSNAAALALGVSYAMNSSTTFVTNVAVGLTQDAPNFQISFKVPYAF